MLDLVALASHVQDRFRQVQDMSVIEEVMVRLTFGFIAPIYLAVGHFFESHPGNVDWILSMTCIICM